ncbi:MAG: hypothetical protein AAFN30_10695 [Actinomycetota bacterium]
MFAVDAFIEQCKQARTEDPGPLAMRDVVAQAVADPTAILDELGEPTRAGFDALYRSDDLTILNFAWAPLMTLLPHDHNDMWAVVGLYSGREDNIMWRRNGDRVEASGAAAIGEKEVCLLGGDVVHSVINPLPRMTLALHVYGGDFFAPGRSEWDPETLLQRPFDIEASARSFAEANRRFHQS